MEGWSAMLVESDDGHAPDRIAALESAGGTVTRLTSVTQAVSHLLDELPDVVVVAVELPDESGTALVQHIRASQIAVPVIALCPPRVEARVECLSGAADDAVDVTVDPRELAFRCLRLMGIYGRIRTLESDAQRLHGLSVTDGLTQIANHRAFQERLREEFRRAQRYDDPLALILVDVDHFKQVNDQHGHQMGDEVLRQLAASLRESLRETDFLARYGGEEFAALLPKTHLAGALTVAERISDDLKKLKVGPAAIRVTASFGVSSFPARSVNSPDQLLKTADEALYRSKREGRNKISLYQAPFLAHAD